VTVADFKTALDEAKLAASVWQAAELSDKKSLAQSYRALTRLAETLALVEQAAAEDTTAAQELLKSLVKHTAKFDFVAEVVPLWVPAAKRPNNGVVLIGIVKSIRQQGALYETQLETAADGATFVLLSNFDPAANCPVDARILASGVVIPKPAEELNGYQGQAAPAVWLGTTATITAP
jgi:hypothetical protein